MVLPVVIAVISLVGAPAGTSVTCGVPVPQQQMGWTWWNQSPPVVLLNDDPCMAVVYASATPTERDKIRDLNPGINLDATTVIGLLVLTHELTHASGVTDETAAECNAMKLLPQVLVRAGLPAEDAQYAVRWDSLLPAAYHEYAC